MCCYSTHVTKNVALELNNIKTLYMSPVFNVSVCHDAFFTDAKFNKTYKFYKICK